MALYQGGMSCVEIKSQKYQTRKSPAYHAKDCKDQVKEGKDGTYESKPDKNGTYKWIKQTRKQPKKKGVKTYEIHSNGTTPFVVEDDGKGITVFKTVYAKGVYEADAYTLGKQVVHQAYKKIFVGDNDLKLSAYEKKGWAKGNSILVQISANKYMYVGDKIYTFESLDTIQSYYSPVGNSDVPYPWAIGTNHTYLMLDAVTIPSKFIDILEKDPYQVYYGFVKDHPPIQRDAKKLTKKILVH